MAFCSAITKAGNACSFKAKTDCRGFCGIHIKLQPLPQLKPQTQPQPQLSPALFDTLPYHLQQRILILKSLSEFHDFGKKHISQILTIQSGFRGYLCRKKLSKVISNLIRNNMPIGEVMDEDIPVRFFIGLRAAAAQARQYEDENEDEEMVECALCGNQFPEERTFVVNCDECGESSDLLCEECKIGGGPELNAAGIKCDCVRPPYWVHF